jgi:NADH dehydrogenase
VRGSSDAAKVSRLESFGAKTLRGDLKDRASLQSACEGVRWIVSTASSTLSRQERDSIQSVDEEGQLRLVEVARGAGVEHFVFVSFRDNALVQYPLTRAKRAVEKALVGSGLAYTILRASYFMEVWLSPALGFDATRGTARVYGDGTGRISWVSFEDVARVAVAALDEPRARNAVFDVGGPEPLGPLDVVSLFEALGAPKMSIEHVPVAALQARMAAASDPLEQSFAGLMLQYAAGDAMDTKAVAELFPGPSKSVRDFAAAQLAR